MMKTFEDRDSVDILTGNTLPVECVENVTNVTNQSNWLIIVDTLTQKAMPKSVNGKFLVGKGEKTQ